MGYQKAKPYKGQDFHKLKAACIKRKALFVDSAFPPCSSSIFYSRQAPADIIWKRPGDIASVPKFFCDGASADDFAQGSLGNCWFVAACACVAEDSRLWKKVVPDHLQQDWHPNNKYAGIFHFKFWRCGDWIDVVIDDFLPTRNGRLIYTHSKTRNEFWPALLEKAYAKLFGDYESLTAGKARDAMVDMTGGAGEGINMVDYRSEQLKMTLFNILHKAMEHRSLISTSIAAKSSAELESRLSIGLVVGHAYSVTAVRNIKLGKGLLSVFNQDKIHMIRCRNPWGGIEWKGPWSDGSAEWRKVSESEKKDLGLTFDENGEFWMAFEDFCRYFTTIDICHIINTSMLSLKKTWREGKAVGEWRRPSRSGGCGNHASYLNNPQFLFDIEAGEDEVKISLEQADKRVDKDKGDKNDTIGFSIMKADLNRKYRLHDKLDIVHSGPYIEARNVFARVTLKPGRYCIVPSTFNPGDEGKFVLRLYAANLVNFRELKLDEPKPPTCCGTPRLSATSVTVSKAQNLPKQDREGGADPYCIIKCEGKIVTTSICKDTLNPEWGERATFYRKKSEQDIVIEVWNSNILKDEFMGQVTLLMSKSRDYVGGNIIVRYVLYGRGEEATQQKQGYLWLTVKHTTNMSDV